MVDEFKVVTIMNEAILKTLKENQQNYNENLEIQKCLEDEAFFFKIKKENAQTVLQKIGVQKSQLENVYKKLIAPNIYYELLNCGKIKENDKNIIIKYDTYNSEKLFNKKRNSGGKK